MICDDFLFNGSRLSDYSLMMVNPDEDMQFSTREIDRSEITAVRPKPNFYSTRYSEPLVFNMLVMKDECSNPHQKDKVLSGVEIGQIREWLESPTLPTKLVFIISDMNDIINYYGVFTSVQPYALDEICYGLKLEFTCNAPYGLTDPRKYTCTFSGSTAARNITVDNISDDTKAYIYPAVTINAVSTFGSDKTITIKNTTDSNNTMTVKLPSGKSALIIDCERKVATDNDGNTLTMSDLGITTPISSDYNFLSAESYLFYWLRLVHGKNTITITPADSTISTVEISAKFINKSGGF